MEAGKLIFVTGGVRSGKSSYAEKLAVNLSRTSELYLHYVACGVPSDREMAERIARHRENRINASVQWTTWESPYRLQGITEHFSKQDVLVLDCVTTLLNNYLFDLAIDQPEEVMACILTDIASLQKASAGLIVVSNEVVQGLPYEDSVTKTYQYILGNVHQRLVNRADTAYLVENGMPVCKKGVMA